MDRDMRLRKVCPQCYMVVHVKRINPRRACAARVTVLGSCVCVCVSVRSISADTSKSKP